MCARTPHEHSSLSHDLHKKTAFTLRVCGGGGGAAADDMVMGYILHIGFHICIVKGRRRRRRTRHLHKDIIFFSCSFPKKVQLPPFMQ